VYRDTHLAQIANLTAKTAPYPSRYRDSFAAKETGQSTG
jgi:hypothetical protein